jgi:hypothetical protein
VGDTCVCLQATVQVVVVYTRGHQRASAPRLLAVVSCTCAAVLQLVVWWLHHV